MADLPLAAVEAAAKAIVWDQFQGCVSWEDTDDTATTGSEDTRGHARQIAKHALEAAFPHLALQGPPDKRFEGALPITEHSIKTTNDELVTVREAMRGLNRLIDQLERGERDKVVLMRRGQMVAVVIPLRLWEWPDV